MFTGLVEGQGTVVDLRTESSGIRIVLDAPVEICSDAELGASIAINGCCLTIVEFDGPRWSFQAGEETLSKTNLGDFKPGDRVNLERALAVGDRLGGHVVQGHVDGVGTVDAIDRDAEWVTMWFRIPPHLARQLVPKGSVAVDGISLTVVDVEPERFSVALIPHTLQVTTLGQRAAGDRVNLETDILGKYVQRLMEAGPYNPITSSDAPS